MEPNWNDWRWQLKNAIRNGDDLKSQLSLTPEEEAGLLSLRAQGGLPLTITPHFLRLIDVDNPLDPLRLQLVPRASEFKLQESERRDPLGEEDHEVVPHLVHRYPDRVLLLITDRCASYCRFCTRKRWVGQGPTPKASDLEQALAYIRAHPEVKEVLVSGGDALLLGDENLAQLLSSIRAIQSVEIIRLATRMLTFAPMRITNQLVDILQQHHPVYVMSHINHPQELASEAKDAILKLTNAGIPVLNQTVLLRQVNNDVQVLATLFRELTRLRARPYYLHQCDVASGTAHFRVPIGEALALVKKLRGHISGLCIPTFMIDIPGGFGKVPMVPDPVVKREKDRIFLEGFRGEIAAYPTD